MKRSACLLTVLATVSACSSQPSLDEAVRCAALSRMVMQSNPQAPYQVAQIERNAFNHALEVGGISQEDLEVQVVTVQLVDLPREANMEGGFDALMAEVNACMENFLD